MNTDFIIINMHIIKVFSVCFIACLFTYSCLQMAFLWRKFNMHRAEKALQEQGITPSSSELKSIVTLSDDKKGVIETKTPNANWYHRLVKK